MAQPLMRLEWVTSCNMAKKRPSSAAQLVVHTVQGTYVHFPVPPAAVASSSPTLRQWRKLSCPLDWLSLSLAPSLHESVKAFLHCGVCVGGGGWLGERASFSIPPPLSLCEYIERAHHYHHREMSGNWGNQIGILYRIWGNATAKAMRYLLKNLWNTSTYLYLNPVEAIDDIAIALVSGRYGRDNDRWYLNLCLLPK